MSRDSKCLEQDLMDESIAEASETLKGDMEQPGPLYSTLASATRITFKAIKPRNQTQPITPAPLPNLLSIQRRQPGSSKVFPPQLRREDAFTHNPDASAEANSQRQSAENRGVFLANQPNKNQLLNQAYGEAYSKQDEEWTDAVAPRYPTSHPYSRFPQLQAETAIRLNPHALTVLNLTMLNAQIIGAEHMAEAAELSAKYPGGQPSNFVWSVEPNPENTKSGRRILKWVADVEILDSNIDEDEDPNRTSNYDYNQGYGNAYDITRNVSVAAANISLPDIKPGEAAIVEIDEGSDRQFTCGREHKSADETCREIYRMYLWMRDMNDQQRPMGMQMQHQSVMQAPMLRSTWAEARRDTLRAVGRSDARRTPDWEDLGRRRRDGAEK